MEEEAKDKYTYSKEVIRYLKKIGLGNIERPVLSDELEQVYDQKAGTYFNGQMPSSLKKFSLDDISALHSQFLNWYAYLTQEATKVEMERAEASKKGGVMWSMVRMKHLKAAKKIGSSLTDQKCSDLARYDKRYVDPDSEYEELNALHKILEANLKIADRNLKVISREVTIREAQIHDEARGRGIPNRHTRNAGNVEERRRRARGTTGEAPSKTGARKTKAKTKARTKVRRRKRT